ncbi:hypothetical protein [Streptomyces sp. NPDC058964]|uniref:hypothetical protein n=1 Tax=Streptomyces sp. NPDC058964 TaxID=3346681 RepID=UPI0036816F3C
MKRRVEFTERAGRLRDYLPADDRRNLVQLVGEIAADPYGARTHLAYIDDEVTRSVWHESVMVHYVVTLHAVIVVDTDVYDAERGFNVV